ncbi:VasL domain-containing protein [Enterobacter cloacae]|uniref:VasL domain-containing protein n=1 Tax=Enterobacter cloacae TaxID=550 RepID=UPI0024B4E817|nr:VasL domain-containing protein [Enterobacter cloacae]
MMNPVPWLQMTNMISYQGLVRTFLNSAVPAEEQLRQLADLPENQPWPVAQQSQTEQHLQQLIARYALMKQKTAE